MKCKLAALMLPVACLTLGAFQASAAAEAPLRKYRPVWSLSGKVTALGSGTFEQELIRLADTFQRIYRGVEVAVEKSATVEAPPALASGKAQIGVMSRSMTRAESARVEEKSGAPPEAFPVALDALAILVHPENPIRCLSLPQIDAIFSANRLTADGKVVATWGDLGLSGDWREKSPVAFGRRAGSTTTEFFRNAVLGGDVLRPGVTLLDDGLAVAAAVAANKFAIGYSSIGFLNSGVRAVPIATPGEGCVEPTAENVARGRYPLTRSFYLYLARSPDAQLNAIAVEFVRYVLSREGQLELLESGLVPVGRDVQDINDRKLKAFRGRRAHQGS
jgi:phosphate transport system substrate-binding protein